MQQKVALALNILKSGLKFMYPVLQSRGVELEHILDVYLSWSLKIVLTVLC